MTEEQETTEEQEAPVDPLFMQAWTIAAPCVVAYLLGAELLFAHMKKGEGEVNINSWGWTGELKTKEFGAVQIAFAEEALNAAYNKKGVAVGLRAMDLRELYHHIDPLVDKGLVKDVNVPEATAYWLRKTVALVKPKSVIRTVALVAGELQDGRDFDGPELEQFIDARLKEPADEIP